MLIDEVEVTIKSGNGGEGVVSFGKGSKSGPDGGNGGKGGDVYLLTSSDLTLLNQFQPKPFVSAENGVNGSKDKKAGRMGKDLVLNLPIGSLIKDLDTKEEFELDTLNEKFLFCVGGDGGIGNFDLRSSRNTTPIKTIPPKSGQKRKVKIILRFLADYGLIGLPNAGKSSLLNELTSTNVKTANYNFTTLSPNLGVLPNKKILADIPGLIEGASKGKGLGIKFLKHIEKVGLLMHCISTESTDVIKDYEIVRNELKEFSIDLLKKDEIILLTKSDLLEKSEINKLVTKLKKLKKKTFVLSIHDEDALKKIINLLE